MDRKHAVPIRWAFTAFTQRVRLPLKRGENAASAPFEACFTKLLRFAISREHKPRAMSRHSPIGLDYGGHRQSVFVSRDPFSEWSNAQHELSLLQGVCECRLS
jgi:hypothetical protein